MKIYDASSTTWYSQSADKDFSHQVYPDEDNLMVVVNYEWYPVTLWNKDVYEYQDGKTYRMVILLMAIGGQVNIGPDYSGGEDLLYKVIYESGNFQSDNNWHFYEIIFTAKNSAHALPFIRFYEGLGGKVHHLFIDEIDIADNDFTIGFQGIEELLIIDPDLIALPTKSPDSRITLHPDFYKTPEKNEPEIRPTPKPSRK